ncbi:MAG: hypothetical protein QY323_03425 [Patescibacteria group bacterium]|nr:MAG: hypothetical protein QY323_03425 [Patescibacteria group bacterium]
MRTLLSVVFVALSLMLCARTVRADTFHLPCDPTAAISVGGGFFKGKTTADGVGDITFDRWMIGMPRLELTLLENCGRDSEDHPTVTRWWLGRLNVFGSIIPEQNSLTLRNTPKTIVVTDENGEPLLDTLGNPVTTTENTLVEAGLNGGTSYSYTLGARASLLDATHFHVESYVEYTSTFGWNGSDAGTVIAHVNGNDIDVSPWIDEFADVMYRYKMLSYGVTIGVPLRRNTLPNWRFTPFATAGRTHFSADVEARVDRTLLTTLEAFGVEPETITRRRSVTKKSWSGLGGVRADIRRNFSIEGSFSYGETEKTTIKVFMIMTTVRFDIGNLWEMSRHPIAVDNYPF